MMSWPCILTWNSTAYPASPERNIIERLWKVLRRRAIHNRLFNTLADLKAALRASLCY